MPDFLFWETPRLDALASEGMYFRNAFVTTSLCSPSRSAMLTGQYNHTNGIIDNRTPLSPRPTWATALQQAGYNTVYIGKWHHGMQKERPGFDQFASYLGQGDYINQKFMVSDKWWDRSTEGYVDEKSVDFAIDFLEQKTDTPFAMMVGFKAVHEPFVAMNEHRLRYADDVIQTSPNWKSRAPWVDFLRQKPPAVPWGKNILRTMDGVDLNVGRLLDALDRLNLVDNTLVIFTSDNGYYFGENHLGDKRSAYEESIRVPMIIRFPGRVPAGAVSYDLVLNIDLAPTILDMADQDVLDSMQGQSLRPLFAEQNQSWREAFLYEYWQLPFDRQRF